MINVKTDSTSVNAIFPVTFAAPGSNPSRLLIRIKKKVLISKASIFCNYDQC